MTERPLKRQEDLHANQGEIRQESSGAKGESEQIKEPRRTEADTVESTSEEHAQAGAQKIKIRKIGTEADLKSIKRETKTDRPFELKNSKGNYISRFISDRNTHLGSQNQKMQSADSPKKG